MSIGYAFLYSVAQQGMKVLYDLSGEDLYLHFVKNFPGFTDRIPQYLLASYLGITPEYLSEVKKNLRISNTILYVISAFETIQAYTSTRSAWVR